MAVSDDKPAPYATTSSILEIIDRYRNRGMQKPFTKDVLARSGVSDSLIPRTIQSLQALDLITDEGMPTDTLEKIRLVATDEYHECLTEWIKGAYADVFSYVEPSTDDETKIRDAFRTYKPTGQQDRMVKLFVGLCEEAGIREKTQKKERKPRARKPSVSKKSVATHKSSQPQINTNQQSFGNLPSAIVGLINSLPSEGHSWTQSQHDKFSTTFEAILSYCYPIVEESETEPEENE